MADNLPKFNRAGLIHGDLFNTGSTKVPKRVGELDLVVILGLLRADNFPHQVSVSVAPVELSMVTGMLKGQHVGLVQGDVTQGLPRRVKL